MNLEYLSWSDLWPIWIETRSGCFWTSNYQDILSRLEAEPEVVYIIARSRTVIRDPRYARFDRLYPFWHTSVRTRDELLAVYSGYQKAKDRLLKTDDELIYLAKCWILESDSADRIRCMSFVWEKQPVISQGRPGSL